MAFCKMCGTRKITAVKRENATVAFIGRTYDEATFQNVVVSENFIVIGNFYYY